MPAKLSMLPKELSFVNSTDTLVTTTETLTSWTAGSSGKRARVRLVETGKGKGRLRSAGVLRQCIAAETKFNNTGNAISWILLLAPEMVPDPEAHPGGTAMENLRFGFAESDSTRTAF